jgi:hypothetical protein
MVCHILCPECSEDLSEVFPFYEKVKQGYCNHLINEEKIPIHLDKIDLKMDIITNFGFIFNALRLTNECCRIHILGNLDFDSIYY